MREVSPQCVVHTGLPDSTAKDGAVARSGSCGRAERLVVYKGWQLRAPGRAYDVGRHNLVGPSAVASPGIVQA